MATAQQIIDQAMERSNLNDPDLVPEAQLLDYIDNYQRRVYLIAARENPDFFGQEGNTNARGAATDNWDLESAPGNVGAVSKIEVQTITGSVSGISTGDEVHLISIRQPHVALSPRAYLRNKKIFEYNEELQDDSSNFVTRLKIYYSHLPSSVSDTSDSLDLPDEFNNLVVLPLARTLAARDQRPEEAQVIDQEYQIDLSTFLQQVSVFDEATIRELGQIPASSQRLGGEQSG